MARVNLNAIIAKHNGETAEADPVPDASGAPPAGASEAGSAPVDAMPATPVGDDGMASPAGATIHDTLSAKLQADRHARKVKQLRRQSKADAEAAAKIKAEAEADRKAAADEKAKTLGMSHLERARADGKDPRAYFKELQQEAIEAGTPAAMEKAIDAKMAAKLAEVDAKIVERVAPLEKTIEELTKERDQLRAQNRHQGFQSDFQRELNRADYAPLLDEYEPEQLFGLVRSLAGDPQRIFSAAKSLNVRLTADDDTFTMQDILNVMKATQAAHNARIQQRRQQSAAPQTSQAGQQQPPQAKPSVNGTVARNAATTIGNDLASSRVSEADMLKGMTKDQRSAFLQKKYG